MKSVYKLLIDIGPLAVFFIFYTRSGLQEAILPLMIATVISVIISYILEKKIPIMPTLGACLLYTSPSPRDATLSRMPSSA